MIPPHIRSILTDISFFLGLIITIFTVYNLTLKKTLEKKLFRPLDSLDENLKDMRKEFAIDKEVAGHFFRKRIMGNYDEYMARGWITHNEKRELLDDIAMYRKNGLNHIMPTIEDDIRNLKVLNKFREIDYSKK